jgi:4-amino-4-deoxy-L-arabinose transferase-like glycosyltransferase
MQIEKIKKLDILKKIVSRINCRSSILSLLFFLFIFLRVPVFFKDLATEEGLFIKTGVAYLEKGKPEIYFDELRPNFINFDKPPLSRIFIGATYKLTGDSVWGARLTPFIFSLFFFFLILYLIKNLYRGKRKEAITYIALLFYSIIPIAIHGAGEIQIDYIVSFFIAIYLFGVFAKVEEKNILINSYPIIFLSLLLSFATKYEPTLMAVFLINIYLVSRRLKIRKILFINLISFGAIFSYLLMFYFYTYAFLKNTGYFYAPINVIAGVWNSFFIKRVTSSVDINKFATNISLILSFIKFTSIPLIFLSMSSMLNKEVKKDKFVYFNFLIMVVFFLIYSAVGWTGLGFPRYYQPMIVSLIILAAINVDAIINTSLFRKKFYISIFLIVGASLFYFSSLDKIFNFTDILLVVKILLILFVAFFFFQLRKLSLFKEIFVTICCLYFILFSIFWIKKDVFSEKLVTANYGQYGFSETVKFLKSRLDYKKDFILANDNIGFHYGNRFYFWDNIFPYPDVLEKYLNNDLDRTRAFIMSEPQLENYPKIKEYIIAQKMKKYTIGTVVFFTY